MYSFYTMYECQAEMLKIPFRLSLWGHDKHGFQWRKHSEEDGAAFQLMGLKKINSSPMTQGSMTQGNLPLLHLKILRQRPYKYPQGSKTFIASRQLKMWLQVNPLHKPRFPQTKAGCSRWSICNPSTHYQEMRSWNRSVYRCYILFLLICFWDVHSTVEDWGIQYSPWFIHEESFAVTNALT